MKQKQGLVLLIMILLINSARSQNIDTARLNELKNKSWLPYVDSQNVRISRKSIDVGDIKVVFYSFILNKAEKKAKIQGRILDPSILHDSDGVINYIFLASVPDGYTLTNIRTLGTSYERLNTDAHKNEFPYRTGDFQFEFAFNSNERLFFNGYFSSPLEYNIGKLLDSDQ